MTALNQSRPQAKTVSKQQITKDLTRIKRKMQGLKNEMDFIEILTNFWPLPNMASKMERMETQMHILNHQYELCLRQLSAT